MVSSNHFILRFPELHISFEQYDPKTVEIKWYVATKGTDFRYICRPSEKYVMLREAIKNISTFFELKQAVSKALERAEVIKSSMLFL